MKPEVNELWEHYKTKGVYVILGIGRFQVKNESLDMEECVIYKDTINGLLWVRPVVDFIEEVRNESNLLAPRFKKLLEVRVIGN